MMDLLQPLNDMPLIELIPQFIAQLRDRMAEKHRRRLANYVMAVVSVACEHGKEQGILKDNPVRGVKRLKRPRGAPQANRPWTEAERRIVLTHAPVQVRMPVALAMFTGLRKGDVLALTKSAIRDGQIWRRTQLDFGQNLNGLAIDQGTKHGVHQFLYGHGQAETARKIAVVSTYPANALSPALSKLAKVELRRPDKKSRYRSTRIWPSYWRRRRSPAMNSKTC